MHPVVLQGANRGGLQCFKVDLRRYVLNLCSDSLC